MQGTDVRCYMPRAGYLSKAKAWLQVFVFGVCVCIVLKHMLRRTKPRPPKSFYPVFESKIPLFPSCFLVLRFFFLFFLILLGFLSFF